MTIEMTDVPKLIAVRDVHRIDEAALARYLGEHLDGDFSDLKVEQYEGGQSNPTFKLRSGDRAYVLRKKPPGKLLKSAHAVDREYRIMTALRDTDVPVPKTYALCEDESVIGTAFFVMEHMEGRVMTEVSLPTLSKVDQSALYDDFARVLAALHAVDHESVGLGDYGRPGNYYTRQISRWTKQYEASKTDDIPEMDSLMEWLAGHIPAAEEISIAHGDYRVGNTIVHPTEPRVVAVLDWELSTIGHPIADVAYFCMMYHLERMTEGPFPPVGTGIPSEEEFLSSYCKYAGRDEIENWRFYMIYNLFRSAAITQGVYKRGLDGIASSQDWKERSSHTRASAEHAWAMVQEG